MSDLLEWFTLRNPRFEIPRGYLPLSVQRAVVRDDEKLQLGIVKGEIETFGITLDSGPFHIEAKFWEWLLRSHDYAFCDVFYEGEVDRWPSGAVGPAPAIILTRAVLPKPVGGREALHDWPHILSLAEAHDKACDPRKLDALVAAVEAELEKRGIARPHVEHLRKEIGPHFNRWKARRYCKSKTDDE